MSRRYSRIRQGAYYNAALTNYITYLQNSATRPRNIGTQGARNLSKVVYTTPFAFDLDVDEVVSSRMNPQHYTEMASFVNGTTSADVTDALGSKNLVSVAKYSAPRVVWFRNASRSVQVVRSAVTDQQYQKYNGERSSIPFGRGTATDDLLDAFNDVKAALLALSGLALNRVSLQPEKFTTAS